MVRLSLKSLAIVAGCAATLVAQQPATAPNMAGANRATQAQTRANPPIPANGTAGIAKPASGKLVQSQPQQPPQQAVTLPPTPEQMPPQPPQVSFANGMLTITAQNSTLADVLTAVRRQTGAGLELPPGAANERIAAHLGPGAPRDVMASLLNGSRFDYIILGSLQKPGGLDRIILTARQNTPAPTTNAQSVPPNAAPSQNPAPDTEVETEEDNAPERDAGDAAETEQPDQPEQQQPQQQQQPGQPATGPQGQGGEQQGNQDQPQQPQVKTPEQLLRELQQMRQQQQQAQPQTQPQQPQDTPNQPPQ